LGRRPVRSRLRRQPHHRSQMFAIVRSHPRISETSAEMISWEVTSVQQRSLQEYDLTISMTVHRLCTVIAWGIGDTVIQLTDTQIRNAKPTAKAFKLSDGGGMYLIVTPANARYCGWTIGSLESVDAIPARGSVDFVDVCGLMLPIDQRPSGSRCLLRLSTPCRQWSCDQARRRWHRVPSSS
jgi:hypothetical protein